MTDESGTCEKKGEGHRRDEDEGSGDLTSQISTHDDRNECRNERNHEGAEHRDAHLAAS
jgi:hypothetical protein